MNDDGELLQKFADTRDDACFETIVQRYIGFVHAVSLRRLHDPHSAHDATQAVFIALARKAAKVAQAPSVMGWLHRSACYEAQNLMRAQANRISRETEALRLGTTSPQPSTDIEAIEAVLDAALGQLSERDRHALLARYFAGNSYAEIGATFRLSENAARMRVDRALEKLRSHLFRKGITCTAAALATALPACATAPVATGMVATVTTASVASALVASGIASIFTIMSTAKIVTGTVVVAAVAGYFYQSHKTSQLETALASLQAEHSATTKKIEALQHQVGSSASTAAAPQTTGTAKLSATAIPMTSSPGITPKAPTGWKKNGSATDLYEAGVDETQPWGGMPSAYVKSTGDAEGKFGGMMQAISADAYRNQRVKLTGWIKTEDANDGGGHLWMRIDGSENGKLLAFDNMKDRAPTGTTDWEEYSVVLDVPTDSSRLNYGFFVSGKGKMWVNGLTITPVGDTVQSTDMLSKAKNTLPTTPVNLGFSPTNSK